MIETLTHQKITILLSVLHCVLAIKKRQTNWSTHIWYLVTDVMNRVLDSNQWIFKFIDLNLTIKTKPNTYIDETLEHDDVNWVILWGYIKKPHYRYYNLRSNLFIVFQQKFNTKKFYLIQESYCQFKIFFAWIYNF